MPADEQEDDDGIVTHDAPPEPEQGDKEAAVDEPEQGVPSDGPEEEAAK